MRRAVRFWTALLLVLALGTSSCSITQVQWERARAPLAGTTFSAALTAVGVLVSGPAGLAIAGLGIVGGTVVNRTLEPEPEVHTKTIHTVVQVPPPLPDGTPQKPRVDTYSIDADGVATHEGARGDLKLPAPDLHGLPPVVVVTFWERVWLALQVVWWVFVGLFALVYLLKHPKVRATAWGCVCWACGALWRLAVKGWEALRRALRKTPEPPPFLPPQP